ncbi:hypothetical protein FRC06_008756 [Ceratobasidium sp. 370]|nr:hypothetical protein FRC06_008756 [Ceratobasidium sp. 370]
MIHHWKGTFKWIDTDDEAYHLGRDTWRLIGDLTAQATCTIPSQFASTLLNIDTDMGLYKAEAFSFWFMHLAPILLNGRLNQEHYEHFLEIREIIIWCLELEITDAQVDALEQKVNQWVQGYERLYYRYDHDRLPACVLTIHALLHMPYSIWWAGPLPCSWSCVVERFCGHLLRPAIANRVRPYDTLKNFVRQCAHLQIVSHVHGMPELLRVPTHLTLQAGELISSKEKIYDFLPHYVLGQLVRRMPHPPHSLKRQMAKYFGVAEGPPRRQGPRPTRQELFDKIDWNTLVRYGCFHMTSMGDRVRTTDLIRNDGVARDNSFIRYELLPDANADCPNERDQAVRRIYYGHVHDVFYVQFIRDPATNTQIPYLLVRVEECNTRGLDASRPKNPIVTYNRPDTQDIINLGTVHAAIGRVKVGRRNTCGIVDRSRGVCTQFNDDEGAPDLEHE